MQVSDVTRRIKKCSTDVHVSVLECFKCLIFSKRKYSCCEVFDQTKDPETYKGNWNVNIIVFKVYNKRTDYNLKYNKKHMYHSQVLHIKHKAVT